MAGDTIEAAVRAFYRQQATSQNNAGVPAEDMAVSLMQALGLPMQAAASTHEVSPQARLAAPQGGITSSDLNDLKNKDPQNKREDKPKAYLNYVFFDNQFNFVEDGSGVKQVDGDPNQLETLASGKVVAKENGYVYVYTSNESSEDVLFDNMDVLDITGPVLEETHYYPFGLTMSAISTTAPLRLEAKRKFNGIEFNHKEFSDGTGLDLYTAKFRGLDPQIGRWWQIDPQVDALVSYSPYESMGSNPINSLDPLGNFRTKFGAWIYKLLHGGGEIGRNQYNEYYVAQTNVSRGDDGIATVTTKMLYGEGRDKYSSAREKLLKDIAEKQDIDNMVRMGIWDPNLTSKEAGRNAVNLGLLVVLPKFSFKAFSMGTNTSETIVTSEMVNKTLSELQEIAKENAPMFRKLFGVGREGAQTILNNIENVRVPEGLTKEAMQAYRELINRVPDPTGTQAVRAKILDYLLK